MKRLDWDSYFMTQALLIRSRSTCDRAYVGAVIVKDNRVISTGYNGSVTGTEHCSGEDGVGHHLVEGHCVRTVHAEANAILQCSKEGISVKDSTIYVTHFPCLNCTKSIIQSGIKKVIYNNDYRIDEFAKSLLLESNIELIKFEGKLDEETINNIMNLN